MLEGTKVTKRFGGLDAVKDVDFRVEKGEIVGLIGPNGAGKTTLFNVINGIYPATSGVVKFEGKAITSLPAHKICKLGIGRTFQIVLPFKEMTVLENVLAGALHGRSENLSMKDCRHEALEALKLVELSEKKDLLAGSLNLAERRLLEIARAIATNPKILLLDETVAGLNPTEANQSMNLVRKIRDDLQITVLWIEHVMKAIMNVADRVIVLHHGLKIADGTPSVIADDNKVIDAYLGEKYLL